ESLRFRSALTWDAIVNMQLPSFALVITPESTGHHSSRTRQRSPRRISDHRCARTNCALEQSSSATVFPTTNWRTGDGRDRLGCAERCRGCSEGICRHPFSENESTKGAYPPQEAGPSDTNPRREYGP